MTWFERLTGFTEQFPDQVRQNMSVTGETLISLVNGRSWLCGQLEIPSLAELRAQIGLVQDGGGQLSVREVVADVQKLHLDTANSGALFQVASQFNLLEMASPGITPEQGVGIYEYDHTQGPACAIAAGAGTIYRNYFAPVNGQIGQAVDRQIDCLADIGRALGNTDDHLWQMKNGYTQASASGLTEITQRLQSASEPDRDDLRSLLRVGWQRETQVTLQDSAHCVSQVYCAALPVAYSSHPPALWEAFARLVLEASYEAAFCSAILNSHSTGNKNLYLTLLGGGAFGNQIAWIIAALRRALNLYRDWEIEARIVSYGASKEAVRQLVNEFEP